MRGWGFSDIENDVPVTPASVFRIGSITKQFTSAAIMLLVEKGRLSLDDTLGALLPNMPVAWQKATLRQLLNHTSGIPSYTDLGPRWFSRMREDMVPDSLLAFTAKDTMNFAPGSRWRYDNTGYVLLGMILDRTTGVKYPQYLDDRFFKPLGLSATMYCSTEPIIKHRAQGYARQGKQLVNSAYLGMTQPYSAGALCSTVGDLVKWTRALHGGDVVSSTSLAQMTTPIGAAIMSHYGFGLGVDSLAGHRRIGHGGGINGFLSHAAYYLVIRSSSSYSRTPRRRAWTSSPATSRELFSACRWRPRRRRRARRRSRPQLNRRSIARTKGAKDSSRPDTRFASSCASSRWPSLRSDCTSHGPARGLRHQSWS
jgi:D-alanyl-D-alanine carboxypeptidase